MEYREVKINIFISSRRDFLRTTAAVATSIILPRQVLAALSKIKKPIKLGMIADLHQDIGEMQIHRIDAETVIEKAKNVYRSVDELEWHGPAASFGAWTTRMGKPRLFDRCRKILADRPQEGQ